MMIFCLGTSGIAFAHEPNVSVYISSPQTKIMNGQTILIDVKVENQSEKPVIYNWWWCPENGNFDTTSSCFTLDLGNITCLKNSPHKSELLSGHPIEKK